MLVCWTICYWVWELLWITDWELVPLEVVVWLVDWVFIKPEFPDGVFVEMDTVVVEPCTGAEADWILDGFWSTAVWV